eukprot:scaffold81107_cov17-Tisochrysis_lutea.AAC.1
MEDGSHSAEGGGAVNAAAGSAAAAGAETEQGHAHSSQADAQAAQGGASGGGHAGDFAGPGLPQSLDGDLNNGSGLVDNGSLSSEDHPAAAADALQPHA